MQKLLVTPIKERNEYRKNLNLCSSEVNILKTRAVLQFAKFISQIVPKLPLSINLAHPSLLSSEVFEKENFCGGVKFIVR